jgi:hypothetical protein
MRTRRIRVDRILLPKPVPAGMNHLVLSSLTYMYRATNEDTTPIVVQREGPHYRIVDGRHRWMASVVAGRRRVLATIQ